MYLKNKFLLILVTEGRTIYFLSYKIWIKWHPFEKITPFLCQPYILTTPQPTKLTI